MSKRDVLTIVGLAINSMIILVLGAGTTELFREAHAQGTDISLNTCVTITTITTSTVSCPGGFTVTWDGTTGCTFDKITGEQRCTFD
jgi:hypothetical protein